MFGEEPPDDEEDGLSNQDQARDEFQDDYVDPDVSDKEDYKFNRHNEDRGQYGNGGGTPSKSRWGHQNQDRVRYVSRSHPSPGKSPDCVDENILPPPPSQEDMDRRRDLVIRSIPSKFHGFPETAQFDVLQTMRFFLKRDPTELCQDKYLLKPEHNVAIRMRADETILGWCARLVQYAARHGYFVPPLSSIVAQHPLGQFHTKDIIGENALARTEDMSMDLATALTSGGLLPDDVPLAKEVKERVVDGDGYASLYSIISDHHPETTDNDTPLEAPKYRKGESLRVYRQRVNDYSIRLSIMSKNLLHPDEIMGLF